MLLTGTYWKEPAKKNTSTCENKTCQLTMSMGQEQRGQIFMDSDFRDPYLLEHPYHGLRFFETYL
jgi:hypothetical protein